MNPLVASNQGIIPSVLHVSFNNDCSDLPEEIQMDLCWKPSVGLRVGVSSVITGAFILLGFQVRSGQHR